MVREQPASVAIALPKGYTDWTEAVLRLKQSSLIVARDIAEQIEAQLPKPKPEEPSEDWSVVHAGDYYYVRWPDSDVRRWSRRGGGFYDWEDILAAGDVEIIR